MHIAYLLPNNCLNHWNAHFVPNENTNMAFIAGVRPHKTELVRKTGPVNAIDRAPLFIFPTLQSRWFSVIQTENYPHTHTLLTRSLIFMIDVILKCVFYYNISSNICNIYQKYLLICQNRDINSLGCKSAAQYFPHYTWTIFYISIINCTIVFQFSPHQITGNLHPIF